MAASKAKMNSGQILADSTVETKNTYRGRNKNRGTRTGLNHPVTNAHPLVFLGQILPLGTEDLAQFTKGYIRVVLLHDLALFFAVEHVRSERPLGSLLLLLGAGLLLLSLRLHSLRHGGY